MRVGILTLPFNNNYGGYLQAYALMTVLKRMGHQPTLIMRRHNRTEVSTVFKIKFFVKGLLKSLLRLKKYQLFYDVEYSFRHRGRNMLKFVDRFMQPQTPYLYDTNSLRDYCKNKFDAYVVGSDQVWRAIYVPDIRNYFLDFTEGWSVKRIAYAASFGTDKPEYTHVQVCQCGELLKRFDAVSVREKSGIDVLWQFNWNYVSPKLVLDPTLLIGRDEYLKIIPSEKSGADGKIFCYVLDDSLQTRKLLADASEMLHNLLYGIIGIQITKDILLSIEEWLGCIRDANYIITDSFHGAVFSIILHKPFVVLANINRGAGRIVNLLSTFNLEDRIVGNDTNIKEVLNRRIDWGSVDCKLRGYQSESFSFLKESLVDEKR